MYVPSRQVAVTNLFIKENVSVIFKKHKIRLKTVPDKHLFYWLENCTIITLEASYILKTYYSHNPDLLFSSCPFHNIFHVQKPSYDY